MKAFFLREGLLYMECYALERSSNLLNNLDLNDFYFPLVTHYFELLLSL